MLPGGGANQNESRTQAAMRELREKQTLNLLMLSFYLDMLAGSRDHMDMVTLETTIPVCLIEVVGTPWPKT